MKFILKKVRHVHIYNNLKGRVLFIQCLGRSVINFNLKENCCILACMRNLDKKKRKRRRSVNVNKVHMQAT